MKEEKKEKWRIKITFDNKETIKKEKDQYWKRRCDRNEDGITREWVKKDDKKEEEKYESNLITSTTLF